MLGCVVLSLFAAIASCYATLPLNIYNDTCVETMVHKCGREMPLILPTMDRKQCCLIYNYLDCVIKQYKVHCLDYAIKSNNFYDYSNIVAEMIALRNGTCRNVITVYASCAASGLEYVIIGIVFVFVITILSFVVFRYCYKDYAEYGVVS